MKKDKIKAVPYIAAAVCFLLSALFLFTGDGETSMAVVYLCFGATMLCIGAAWLHKSIKPKEGADEDKGEQDGVE